MASAATRASLHTLLLVEKGSGSIRIDGIRYALSANDLFLLSQGQVYAFSEKSSGRGYVLQFSDSFWDKTPISARNCKASLFNDARLNQHLALSPAEAEDVLNVLRNAWKEYRQNDYSNKPDVLAAYLKIIVIKIANINALLSQETNNYHYKIYQRFNELVSSSHYQLHDVASYAKQLGVSSRKLAESCKQYGGKGAKEIIDAQIVAEAKRLLQFTSQPIKAIAAALHFSNPYQFSNFFKKQTNLSPQAYKDSFARIGIQ